MCTHRNRLTDRQTEIERNRNPMADIQLAVLSWASVSSFSNKFLRLGSQAH